MRAPEEEYAETLTVEDLKRVLEKMQPDDLVYIDEKELPTLRTIKSVYVDKFVSLNASNCCGVVLLVL